MSILSCYDFVQKALFSEYRQLEVGGATMYDQG